MSPVANDPTEVFGISSETGFLPADEPPSHLGETFHPWEEAAESLPKLLVSTRLRPTLESLPLLSGAAVDGDHLERAMLVLSYLGHAYVWGQRDAATRLPAPIAVPWAEVAARLDRPPVLSYASYALNNWRRLDASGPIAADNLCLLTNFWGGADEEWFVVIHVDIEARAGTLVDSLLPIQEAVRLREIPTLLSQLQIVRSALEEINKTMARMPEMCDPYIYFQRVRPYIHGWKDHPALPDGLIYDGVERFQGHPQRFRGETGAQSSIIPALDAVLGISHQDDPLRVYLGEMRGYMPAGHRRFLEVLENGPTVRSLLSVAPDPSVVSAYDDCVQLIRAFRAQHLEYAASYIHRQVSHSATNPSAVGTGGTPFMKYLKKHRDETAAAVVSASQEGHGSRGAGS